MTYYRPVYQDDVRFGVKGEIDYSFSDFAGVFLGGGWRQPYTLAIETGWDRFDDLERFRSFEVADIQETSAYLGWRLTAYLLHFHMRLGASVYDIDVKHPGVTLDDREVGVFGAVGLDFGL